MPHFSKRLTDMKVTECTACSCFQSLYWLYGASCCNEPLKKSTWLLPVALSLATQHVNILPMKLVDSINSLVKNFVLKTYKSRTGQWCYFYSTFVKNNGIADSKTSRIYNNRI